jgi:hypothetical protein
MRDVRARWLHVSSPRESRLGFKLKKRASRYLSERFDALTVRSVSPKSARSFMDGLMHATTTAANRYRLPRAFSTNTAERY